MFNAIQLTILSLENFKIGIIDNKISNWINLKSVCCKLQSEC